MKKSIFIAALLCLVFGLTAVCKANPWAQREDHFRVALTAIYTVSNQVYNSSGSESGLTGDINRVDVLVYYDVGFSNKTELSVETGYTRSRPEFDSPGIVRKSNSGASDIWIRYKWQFRDKGLDAALLTGFKIPGSYDKNLLNAQGKGQADLDLGLSAGQYYHATRAYWSLDTIYRWRMSNPANEVEFNAEFGRIFTDHINARVFYKKIDSLGGHRIEDTAYGGGALRFTETESDVDTIGLGLEYRIGSRRAIGFSYTDVIGGKNTLDGTGFHISYIFEH